MNKIKTYFGNGMKKMQAWWREHPFKSSMFVSMVATLAVSAHFLEDPESLTIALTLLALVYGVWCWTFARDTRRMLCIALAGAMLANPRPVQAAPYVIGGIFVTVIGGVIFYKIKKRCEKISKSRTNAWPEELNFVVAGAQDEYAAAFFWPEEACYQERREGTAEPMPVRFTMTVFVEATNSTVSLAVDCGKQFVESFDECKEWAAGHGLFVPGSPQFSESYGRNGHPVTAEQVPITFDWTTRTATVGGGGVTVTVESSDDLKTWRPLARLNVADGSTLEIPDVSAEKRFYRVKTGTP